MKHIARLFALASQLIALPLFCADNTRYDEMPVQKIEVIIANKNDEAAVSSVRARMKTREGTLFSQADFDEDLKVLAKEFDHIEPEVHTAADNKLEIKLIVTPKPVIHRIFWVGNKGIKTTKLEKELAIRQGASFDRDQFNKAFHKLKNYYVRKGYFEAELDYSVKSDAASGGVDIEISIKEGRSGEIKEIVFKNFTDEEREELTDKIFTKEYCIFTSWLTQDGTYKPEAFKQDEMTIINYLHNSGYADAKVDTRIIQDKEKGRITLEISVDRGERYTFADISTKGATLFTNEELLKRIPLVKSGSTYSPEEVREAAQTLLDFYGSRGYLDSQVVPEAKLVNGQHAYNVQFLIEEGEKFRVGLIKVLGNTTTQASVILNESPLVPGDVFNTTLISKTEEKLKNTNYFKNVNVYAVKSKSIEGNFRDVYIEVEENPTTAHFRTGLSYSTTEKIVGSIGLSESNFNYKGIPSIFKRGLKALRGGGEYCGIEMKLGSKMLSYTFSWTKPYFMDSKWSIGLDLNKTRNSYASNDYAIQSYGLGLFANYDINAFVKFGLNYRLQHSFIKLKGISHTHRNRELIRESQNGGLISAIGPGLSYDSTNSPHLPTQGLRSRLYAEYAGLGGDHTFAKMGYLNGYYYSPYKKGLFHFRAELQFIQTFGSTHPKDLPLSERLYAGGETSIRGYVFNRVGPKFHDKQRTVRGGMSEVLLSAEYTQFLFKKLDAFVFFDAGNAYFRQFHLGTLRASWGYGLKIKIREGSAPITIGWGNPINPQRAEDVKKFFITFGTSF